MKYRAVLGIALVAGLVGACTSTPSTPTPDPRVAFCDSLKDVAVAIADYHRLGPEDTTEAYKAAAQNVADAAQTAADAGREMAAEEVEDLGSAIASVRAYLEELPQDIPVSDVEEQIQGLLRQVSAARLSIGVVACEQPEPPSFRGSPNPSA